MTPVIPHLANECLLMMGLSENQKWPIVESKHLFDDEKIIIIQINGKKRNSISTNEKLSKNELIEKINKKKLVEKYIENKHIKNIIYVENRVINYIVK